MIRLHKIAFGAVVLAVGVVVGLRSENVPTAQATCSVPGGPFTWNIHNVAFSSTPLGDPLNRLLWKTNPTNFVGALVKAKYEVTEGNAIWRCAKIVGLNAFMNCPNPADLPMPPGFQVMGSVVHKVIPTDGSPCGPFDPGAGCDAEVNYTITFPEFDGTGRALAQTYYWPDSSALPSAHDPGFCGGGQVYRYVNHGPIYGHPCTNPIQTECYTVLFEQAP